MEAARKITAMQAGVCEEPKHVQAQLFHQAQALARAAIAEADGKV